MNTESGIPLTTLYADEAPSGYIEPPTNTQFHSGVEPEMTLPAAWWNYFVNLFTNTNIKTKEDITAILAELNNVLTTMGITPDPEASNQLATLFQNDVLPVTFANENMNANPYTTSSLVPKHRGNIAINTTTRTIWIATNTTAAAASWSRLWSPENDGSGSGSDADLLDGQHGSYYAPKASPALTGTPTAPTPAAGTNNTRLATTEFVQALITTLTSLVNGKAPTSHASTTTTYGASSEANYGHAKASTVAGSANGTASKGSTPTVFAQSNHVHPLQTSVSGNASTATLATQALAIKPLGSSITLPATPTSVTKIVKIATFNGAYNGSIAINSFGGVEDVIKVHIGGANATSSGIRVIYGKYNSAYGIKKIIVTSDIMMYNSIRQIYAEIVNFPNNGTTTTLGIVETNRGIFTPSMTEVSSVDGIVVDSLSLDYLRGDLSSYQHVFTKNIIGNLTGNVTGNADTATLAADATKLKTARTIGGVLFDGSANINLPGVNTAGNQNTSGNAATATLAADATKLKTARTINGVSFNGTANITVADSTKAPLASPALTGTPTAPTPATATNNTQIATTAFVKNHVNDQGYAPLASPAFTGSPTVDGYPVARVNTTTSSTAKDLPVGSYIIVDGGSEITHAANTVVNVGLTSDNYSISGSDLSGTWRTCGYFQIRSSTGGYVYRYYLVRRVA